MHKFRFYKMSPGGNTTIIITDPVISDPHARASLAPRLLSELHLGGEQVGYLTTRDPRPRLDMMGGEFCGNATRSLAALLVEENPSLLGVDGVFTGEVDVSGASRPLTIRVRKISEAVFDAACEIPMRVDPGAVSAVTVSEKPATLVRLDGICHVLLDDTLHPFPEDNFEDAAKRIRTCLGLMDEDAVGCIWFSCHNTVINAKPVVWVRKTDSTYYETACGSGTAALGISLATVSGRSVLAEIGQPSGKRITVAVDTDGSGVATRAEIAGQVTVIACGEAFLTD